MKTALFIYFVTYSLHSFSQSQLLGQTKAYIIKQRENCYIENSANLLVCKCEFDHYFQYLFDEETHLCNLWVGDLRKSVADSLLSNAEREYGYHFIGDCVFPVLNGTYQKGKMYSNGIYLITHVETNLKGEKDSINCCFAWEFCNQPECLKFKKD